MVAQRHVLPQCEFCRVAMMLRRVFPKTWMLPEVRAYECDQCGNARSIDDGAIIAHAT